MQLKNMGIEDGYTAEVSVSRQDLLMDVRDKLLFEPEYAGNIKENVPPRSSLCIPWTWLPGALCILQEVGEEKLVLEIGRAALKLPDSKPYVHDLFLSMALAECSIAKSGFEKSKVSEGFEALARAQYLLRSKISLEKMPLLAQATAGGGGRGMRLASEPDEFVKLLQKQRSEEKLVESRFLLLEQGTN